jgi:hypothetical protein
LENAIKIPFVKYPMQETVPDRAKQAQYFFVVAALVSQTNSY